MSKRYVRFALMALMLVLLAVASSAVPAKAGTINDDSYPGWTYSGSWSAVTGVSGAINGTLHWSNVDGSEATYQCYGSGFTVYFSKAYNRGKAYMWFEGLEDWTDVVDMYASGVTRQMSHSYSLNDAIPNGYYILHVKVSGLKNASSSDDLVDIDAVEC